MDDSIVIAGHKASVVIKISGYENAAALNPSDANWLRCGVELRIERFSGTLDASFITYDFVQFFSEIRTALSTMSGIASFLTDEETLRLNLKFEKSGRVYISGVAQVLGVPKVALAFSFDSDQSFLTETYHQLEKIIHQFPIKEL